MMAWEKRGDGTGFNSITVQVGVLEASPENPLNVHDLAAIGHDHELKCFSAMRERFELVWRTSMLE